LQRSTQDIRIQTNLSVGIGRYLKNTNQLLRRRIRVIATFTWLPLLLLSVIEGHALGGSIQISFLRDIEAHVRFLIALPALLGAELVVRMRLGSVGLFVERNIVVAEDRANSARETGPCSGHFTRS
jgi:hypothetical protein